MSLRSLTARQVMKSLLPRRAVLGVSRLSDLSGFVDLNIRVVQAVRTNLKRGQVSATSGKGWSLVDAVCGALGEAQERYCASHALPDRIIKSQGSIHERRTLDQLGHPCGAVLNDWCPAESLLSHSTSLLPALEVYFPYNGRDLHGTTVKPHTSGLASGSDIAEATVFGILEVMERHAASRFYDSFRDRAMGSLIDLRTITAPMVSKAMAYMAERGYEYFVFRIDGPVPTYYVAILDTTNLGPKYLVSGTASHLSEEAALEGAFLEAMQALVIAAQGSREDLLRRSAQYQRPRTDKSNPFYRIRDLLAEKNDYLPFTGTAERAPKDSIGALSRLLELLREAAVPAVYRCDLSQPGLPLNVVKVIVPGLFDTFSNPGRNPNASATPQ